MTIRRTPLHESHRRLGARLTEFAGWEMPVFYESLLAEHAAVRSAVGLFDVSHMGEIEVAGPGALALCQWVGTNDASRLAPGQAQYTLLCNERGGTIDDVLLYRLAEERFLFCVNASNRDACREWLLAQAESFPGAEVRDRSDEIALVAAQGPRSLELLRVTGLGEAAAGLSRFACAEVPWHAGRLLLARTGYTGEEGFELFVPSGSALELWERLLAAAPPLGGRAAGLGARDTLRLEAGLPLYGHELGPEIGPIEAGLGWAVKLGKGRFVGAEALARQRAEGPSRRVIGLRLAGRGIARAGYPVKGPEGVVGRVTSGTRAPTLGAAIALALVTR